MQMQITSQNWKRHSNFTASITAEVGYQWLQHRLSMSHFLEWILWAVEMVGGRRLTTGRSKLWRVPQAIMFHPFGRVWFAIWQLGQVTNLRKLHVKVNKDDYSKLSMRKTMKVTFHNNTLFSLYCSLSGLVDLAISFGTMSTSLSWSTGKSFLSTKFWHRIRYSCVSFYSVYKSPQASAIRALKSSCLKMLMFTASKICRASEKLYPQIWTWALFVRINYLYLK